MVKHVIQQGRTLDIILLVVYLGSLVIFGVYVREQNQATIRQLCAATENLKDGQRDVAQATIDGDLAFLKAHPGGTPDFPEAVVRDDIAAKQDVIHRYPPRDCGPRKKEEQ